MLEQKKVMEKMFQRGKLEISANFKTVSIKGIAACDSVLAQNGGSMLRAKFGNGVKAILKLDQYGKTWEAEEAKEEAAETPTKQTQNAQIKISRKEQTIKRWRQKNPEGSKKRCSRETGISLPTIRRYWNSTEQ